MVAGVLAFFNHIGETLFICIIPLSETIAFLGCVLFFSGEWALNTG
jgi:hypothetical protein